VPTSWDDIAFDTTDIENRPSTIEHDNTNTERINIKEDGLYMISFSCSIDADAGEETFDFRCFVNGSTVIPGSQRKISEDDEINDGGNVCYYEFTANDYVTFQVQASGDGNVLIPESTYTVMRVKGPKGTDGAQGPPGSGSTINVSEDGTPLPNTPFETLNFEDMEVTEDSTSQVSIKNVFGSEYQSAKDDTESSTTSSSFQQKLRLTTTDLPEGDYIIHFYCETWQSNAADAVEWQVELNDTTVIATAEQEPDDINDRFSYGGHDILTLSGVNTFDIDWREQRGSTAYIRRARLVLWRVA
jgi:hypothetical protein